MDNDLVRWVKIADVISDIPFNDDGIAEVTADGRKVCIALYKNTCFAFAPKCPHAGGQFVHGFIDTIGNVVCPLHGYKFCLKNGWNISGEGYHLKHWPVAIHEDGVFVGLEKSKLLGLL